MTTTHYAYYLGKVLMAEGVMTTTTEKAQVDLGTFNLYLTS